MQTVGYMVVGSPGSKPMACSLESYGAEAIPHEVLSEQEVGRRFPQFRLQPGEVGIFDPEAARLDPEVCVTAALEVAERNGATLRFDEPVLDWTARDGAVEVLTAKDRYRATMLATALGRW